MKKYQKGYTGGGLLFALLWIVCAIGWVMNIVDIVATLSAPITGLFLLRIVGIFVFPLGAVLGIFY